MQMYQICVGGGLNEAAAMEAIADLIECWCHRACMSDTCLLTLSGWRISRGGDTGALNASHILTGGVAAWA